MHDTDAALAELTAAAAARFTAERAAELAPFLVRLAAAVSAVRTYPLAPEVELAIGPVTVETPALLRDTDV
ncbi:MAG: hypothetical protein ACYDCQ_19825 [Dehalococcoidia bacterium]